MKKNILIVDDDIEVENSWKNSLEKIPAVQTSFEVSYITPSDFGTLMSDLEERRRRVRGEDKLEFDENKLDTTNILIVDYDLLKFNQTSYVTGEGFAYLARCYSRCGLIIALNQFGTNKFDLTLKGNLDSFADLNIGGEQMANLGLWGMEWPKFRPWSWEVVPDFCERLDSITNDLTQRDQDGKQNLDVPIVEYLGITEELSSYLPPAVKSFISGEKNISDVTFRNFVTESDNGLRRKDKGWDDLQVARIAAARIHKWLERRLLNGQDFMVDAPHLVTRFPSLINGPVDKIESWNATRCLGEYARCGIKHEIISEFAFARPQWLSRPAWFWKPVRECEVIDEVNDPWNFQLEHPDLVFAEDISAFIPKEGAKEFYADLPSSFVQRYVVDQESDIGKEYSDELQNVTYEPQLRFAL
jgi:hypothetical protein